MKAGWKTVKLGHIGVHVKGSSMPAKESRFESWSVPSFETGQPEIVDGSSILAAKTPVEVGDVLICKINPRINRVWRVTETGNNLPRICSTEWVVFRANNPSEVLPQWVQIYCSSPAFREWITGQITGTTGSHARAKPSNIFDQEIPLPPLAEQKRIVALLDEAFAGIDEAKAKAEAAQSASGKIFESQVGLSFAENNDWKEATLIDLGKTLTGTTPPTANPGFYGEYIPFVKPADFNEDGTLVIDNHGLSKEGEKVARVTNPDSVLMVCIGATIGKTGYTTKRITTNQQINSFTPGSLVNFKFAYYQMISSSFQKEVLARANQATMPMISKSKWSEINLRFPNSYDTQVKVAERLSELKFLTRKLSETADRKVAALTEIRSSLLAQAFAGELTA